MKPMPKCSLFNSLSSDRSKVKVKVTKRSQTYFGHNTERVMTEICFRPIHVKPTPKGSLFNFLSSDMVTNVALAKVCALLSARSSSLKMTVNYLTISHYYSGTKIKLDCDLCTPSHDFKL